MVEEPKLEEIYRLVQDNNRMLHAMRRSALFGRLFTIIVWAIFLGVPVWLYLTYLAPVMQSMLKTMDQMQSAGNQAQVQFGDFSQAMKDLESKLPAFMQPKQ